VALRKGYWHMSQFAADYRRLFGELPSSTLHRSSWQQIANSLASQVPGHFKHQYSLVTQYSGLGCRKLNRLGGFCLE
jgi:hypothetical protein